MGQRMHQKLNRIRGNRYALPFTIAALALCTATGWMLTLSVYRITAAEQNRTLYRIIGFYETGTRPFPNDIAADEDENMQLETAGRQVLEKLGYGDEVLYERNPQNRSFELMLGFALSILFLTASSGIVFVWRRERKQRDLELQNVLKTVNEYRRGIYDNRPCELGEDTLPALFEELSALARQIGMKEELLESEKEETKSLVTDISHQLKTPVAGLKLSFDVLKDTRLEETEREEFSRRIDSQLIGLENLVNALVQISRMEAGLIEICKDTENLQETVLQAVNAVYAKAARKHITIEVPEADGISEPDCLVAHDGRWTKETIINILDNAVKYSDENTNISICFRVRPDFLRMEIQDEGIGIPKEEYHRIFQRFYRGRQERIRQEDGSGVGLYLARKIIEYQGGNLTVTAPGGDKKPGSIFVIQLPRESLTKM